MATDEDKARLRRKAKSARDALPARDRDGANLVAFGDQVLSIAPKGSQSSVSGFMAIGSELNPVPLMDKLASQGCRLALPVMLASNAPLEFRAWKPGDPLLERKWGIREPLQGRPIILPDVLLVPLLAFDAAGYRLGYGGGYYDRTLARLRELKKIAAIGIAYDIQRVDSVPIGPYDRPLDYVLTPSGLTAVQVQGSD